MVANCVLVVFSTEHIYNMAARCVSVKNCPCDIVPLQRWLQIVSVWYCGISNIFGKRPFYYVLFLCSRISLTLVFVLSGGILANSLAIATDAAHLLTDVASFMISLFSIYLASRPATKRMSFGWYRAGLFLQSVFTVNN